jgi:hypothetical protein
MGTTDETKAEQRQLPMIARGWKLLFLALTSWAIVLGVLYLAGTIYHWVIG